jgi:hypothetical protein
MLRRMRNWRTGARSKDRKHARAALKRMLTAAERAQGQTLAEVQLLGQVMPPRIFAQLGRSASRALAAQQIQLPEPAGTGTVVVWALQAGEEVLPRPRSPRFPRVLRTPYAATIHQGAPVEPAWYQLIALSLADAEPALLAPPVLERFDLDGLVAREIEDLGLRFPLAPLDGARRPPDR